MLINRYVRAFCVVSEVLGWYYFGVLRKIYISFFRHFSYFILFYFILFFKEGRKEKTYWLVCLVVVVDDG